MSNQGVIVKDYLEENGIKPSIQRLKIMEYLLKNYSHPTVDEIFQHLSPEIPTLSKTTIYNTLNLFIEKNIVSELMIEGNEIRYDAIKEIHGHFKCKDCGDIRNIDIDLEKVEINGLKDVKIEETHFYLRGTCEDCSKEEE